MQPVIYLICGVPGAGKTWVCERLTEAFQYIPHDKHFVFADLVQAIRQAVAVDPRMPIITECPFAERELREKLINLGFIVIPYFVVEKPEVVAQRYQAREKKPASKASITRASSIGIRAMEWGAPFGTSVAILDLLKHESKRWKP